MLTTEPRLDVDAIIVYPASMLKSVFCWHVLAKRSMTVESLATVVRCHGHDRPQPTTRPPPISNGSDRRGAPCRLNAGCGLTQHAPRSQHRLRFRDGLNTAPTHPQLIQHSFIMVSTWFQHGFNMVLTGFHWFSLTRSGFKMVSTWFSLVLTDFD